MAKKTAITLGALYLLGLIGVAADVLSSNWNDDWPFQQRFTQAATVGTKWPISVVEVFQPR